MLASPVSRRHVPYRHFCDSKKPLQPTWLQGLSEALHAAAFTRDGRVPLETRMAPAAALMVSGQLRFRCYVVRRPKLCLTWKPRVFQRGLGGFKVLANNVWNRAALSFRKKQRWLPWNPYLPLAGDWGDDGPQERSTKAVSEYLPASSASFSGHRTHARQSSR